MNEKKINKNKYILKTKNIVIEFLNVLDYFM